MIGTALRKYAEARGMACDGGYVYGKVNGRYIALVDGTGVKMLQIYLYPPNQTPDEILTLQMRQILENCDAREYRLIRHRAVNMENGRAVVVFQDGPGAMKRIERYIDEIVPRLNGLKVSADACACCGNALGEDIRHVLLDDYILPVHEECIPQMAAALDELRGKARQGSAARGALGALLGAVLGAIPWAIVYMLGYVAGIAGLLIGFLANLLYGKFGGKNTRVRAVIVVAALILGVLLGQIGGMTAEFGQLYDEEGGRAAAGMTRMQAVQTRWEQVLLSDQSEMLGNMYERLLDNIPEEERGGLCSRDEFITASWDDDYEATRLTARNEFLINLGMGLFFGLLGCLNLFSQIDRETRRRTVRRLK